MLGRGRGGSSGGCGGHARVPEAPRPHSHRAPATFETEIPRWAGQVGALGGCGTGKQCRVSGSGAMTELNQVLGGQTGCDLGRA